MLKPSPKPRLAETSTNLGLLCAAACVKHPVPAVSAVILLANIFIFQRYSPSWFSGKAGDLAWMVFAPILLSALLALLAPAFFNRHLKSAGFAGMTLTAFGFTLLKTSLSVNTAAGQFFYGLFGVPLKLAMDVTDLAVLPGLLIFCFLWLHNSRAVLRPAAPVIFQSTPGMSRIRVGLSLALVLAAAVADMPAPAELGITCLVEKDAKLYAFNTMIYGKNQEILWAAYSSTDGGLTWSHAGSKTNTKSTPTAEENKIVEVYGNCQLKKKTYEAIDPGNSALHYIFAPGTAVYRSEDGGLTLRKELGLADKTVEDFTWNSTTGNLVLALGKGGVAVRGQDGKWAEIPITVFKTVNLY